jgi:hypothetical protein
LEHIPDPEKKNATDQTFKDDGFIIKINYKSWDAFLKGIGLDNGRFFIYSILMKWEIETH